MSILEKVIGVCLAAAMGAMALFLLSAVYCISTVGCGAL